MHNAGGVNKSLWRHRTTQHTVTRAELGGCRHLVVGLATLFDASDHTVANPKRCRQRLNSVRLMVCCLVRCLHKDFFFAHVVQGGVPAVTPVMTYLVMTYLMFFASQAAHLSSYLHVMGASRHSPSIGCMMIHESSWGSYLRALIG